MKKIYFLVMSLLSFVFVQAQQIPNLKVAEVLASDDFEDDAPWVNFDQPGINTQLNNALGGTQSYQWLNTWGGAAVHEGKSAVNGAQCMQLHWGGNVSLQGFEIDPGKVYQLEVMVHPIGGKSGQWNNWAALHLFVFDNSNVWQEQGLRIRLSNNDPTGGSPSLLGLDVWEGEDGTERSVNIVSFSDKFLSYTINDAKDVAALNFWIPLKIVFKGEGSASNPFIIDFYLNDIFVGTETFNNLVWLGDRMIGLQNSSDNPDLTRYDNFKLSVLDNQSGIHSMEAGKIVVTQTGKGALQVTSDVYGKDTAYRLLNISGIAVAQGVLESNQTMIPTHNLPAGIYLLQIESDRQNSTKTIRVLLR